VACDLIASAATMNHIVDRRWGHPDFLCEVGLTDTHLHQGELDLVMGHLVGIPLNFLYIISTSGCFLNFTDRCVKRIF
jgi:hypothetical protein